jgi:hypothetical protein
MKKKKKKNERHTPPATSKENHILPPQETQQKSPDLQRYLFFSQNITQDVNQYVVIRPQYFNECWYRLLFPLSKEFCTSVVGNAKQSFVLRPFRKLYWLRVFQPNKPKRLRTQGSRLIGMYESVSSGCFFDFSIGTTLVLNQLTRILRVLIISLKTPSRHHFAASSGKNFNIMIFIPSRALLNSSIVKVSANQPNLVDPPPYDLYFACILKIDLTVTVGSLNYNFLWRPQ